MLRRTGGLFQRQPPTEDELKGDVAGAASNVQQLSFQTYVALLFSVLPYHCDYSLPYTLSLHFTLCHSLMIILYYYYGNANLEKVETYTSAFRCLPVTMPFNCRSWFHAGLNG